MTIIAAYKKDEALDLKERGLLVAFTVPIGLNDPALTTWKRHLESIGAPYLVIQNGSGFVIHKEIKALRCMHCGAFLNARPVRYQAHLTHKMVGRECAKRLKGDQKCALYAPKK